MLQVLSALVFHFPTQSNAYYIGMIIHLVSIMFFRWVSLERGNTIYSVFQRNPTLEIPCKTVGFPTQSNAIQRMNEKTENSIQFSYWSYKRRFAVLSVSSVTFSLSNIAILISALSSGSASPSRSKQ